MLTHLTETHQEEPTALASANSSSGFIQTTKKKKMSSSSGDKGQLVRAEARIQENLRTPTETLLNMSHTILLVQPTKRPEGRTYADYESVNECMEGVCKMYEEHLKRMNPNSPSITYDISQLFDFIDDLADLSCLVYRADTQTYQPYNKDWIKEKIYVLLRRQAQQAAKWSLWGDGGSGGSRLFFLSVTWFD